MSGKLVGGSENLASLFVAESFVAVFAFAEIVVVAAETVAVCSETAVAAAERSSAALAAVEIVAAAE